MTSVLLAGVIFSKFSRIKAEPIFEVMMIMVFFEINQSAFVIGQSSVIEYLQQNVEDVGVSLFYFVEQNHRNKVYA